MSLFKVLSVPMGYLKSFYGKEVPKAICSNNRLSAICHFGLASLLPDCYYLGPGLFIHEMILLASSSSDCQRAQRSSFRGQGS